MPGGLNRIRDDGFELRDLDLLVFLLSCLVGDASVFVDGVCGETLGDSVGLLVDGSRDVFGTATASGGLGAILDTVVAQCLEMSPCAPLALTSPPASPSEPSFFRISQNSNF